MLLICIPIQASLVLSEGNARVDTLVSTVDAFQKAVASHHFFHQNSHALRKEFKLPGSQAKQIIRECPDCQDLGKALPSIGSNPTGLEPQVIWQTDVTHYPPFGKFKFIHVSIDTFSRALHASALTGESAKNVQAPWLEAFSHLGHLQQVKTDTELGCTAQSTQDFLQRWGIQHKTGIPYNPTGQAIVECAHHTFKTLRKKTKKGEPGNLS